MADLKKDLGDDGINRTRPLVDHGTEKFCRQEHGRHDYLVQRRHTAKAGVEAALSPECPRSNSMWEWELACVAIEGDVVFYYWKRRN